MIYHIQWRTEGGSTPPPPKFRRPSEIVPNSTQLWKLLKIAEFRNPTPQDVRKKGSKILKLPRFAIWFTLVMTNKLVIIIDSLKIPKIKKILPYEMKFLVPLTRGLLPPDPRSLCPLSSTGFVEPPPNKIPGYATDYIISCQSHILFNLTCTQFISVILCQKKI